MLIRLKALYVFIFFSIRFDQFLVSHVKYFSTFYPTSSFKSSYVPPKGNFVAFIDSMFKSLLHMLLSFSICGSKIVFVLKDYYALFIMHLPIHYRYYYITFCEKHILKQKFKEGEVNMKRRGFYK